MRERVVVAMLWSGARVLDRLEPGDPEPTPEELDALATALTPWNDDCVRPTVRVLERAPSRSGRLAGPAGSLPR